MLNSRGLCYNSSEPGSAQLGFHTPHRSLEDPSGETKWSHRKDHHVLIFVYVERDGDLPNDKAGLPPN